MADEPIDAGAGPVEPPIEALVVASWFPTYDDPATGRFVADQVEAIAATGRVRPTVITFDQALLTGGASARGHQADAVSSAGAAATRTAEPLGLRPAWGVEPGIPVVRLTVPDGMTLDAGPAHAAVHRARILDVVADRLLASDARPRGVVHAHTGYPDGAAAVTLADRLGWPLVVTEHSSFVDKILANPARRTAYERMLDRTHRLFAVSSMLAAELRTAFPDHADTIEVLPNAVPIELFAAGRAADRVPDELLFVGYRKANKGIEVLLRSVAIAHEARPTIRLRLVGQTKDRQEEQGWHELASSLGIASIVDFDEPLDRAGVAEAMRRASLFVHPSPRETFGVVAVEALAAGLPVVATDSGGVTEILGDEPERLGALVAADDPAALAAAILETLGRGSDFDPQVLRGSIERRFGRQFVAERLLVAYRDALATRSTPRTRPADPLVGATSEPQSGSSRMPSLLVALDRARAAVRLAGLPASLREALVVVTAIEPATARLPAVGRLVELDIDVHWRVPVAALPAGVPAPVGRLLRLAKDPIGT
ncbi:MAG TPA: glycosyltransferase, partial [Candidatus Limnocylindrales bacterium]|nr:glycosyltransferase [Candidatus Limnocylindrales bacterium]